MTPLRHAKMAGFVSPMLLGSGLPDASDHAAWAAEVKWDGIRAQLRVEASGAWSVRSRHDVGRTARFGELADVATSIPATPPTETL